MGEAAQMWVWIKKCSSGMEEMSLQGDATLNFISAQCLLTQPCSGFVCRQGHCRDLQEEQSAHSPSSPSSSSPLLCEE